MSVHILALEIERFKRLNLITMAPTAEGLTVIGGKNGQGKTSVLDAIVYALGGGQFKPTETKKRGAEKSPNIRLVLSNGLLVERKGKNSSLKVTDPEGLKGGQSVLDKFVEELALNLPKFMAASAKEKARTLLRIIGAGEQLDEFNSLEETVFEERRIVGRELEQATNSLRGMSRYEDAPAELVSVSDLISKIDEADKLRREREDLLRQAGEAVSRTRERGDIIKGLREQIQAEEASIKRLEIKVNECQDAAAAIEPVDVDDLREQVSSAEETNEEVRANQRSDEQAEAAAAIGKRHAKLEKRLLGVRLDRRKLLLDAKMPLEGLSVEDGELVYEGSKWDCMGGADQLKVAASIVKSLNPDCGFVLIDKLEQMDIETMKAFGEWAAGEGLQIIATRVSTGDECSIVIEDGEAK